MFIAGPDMRLGFRKSGTLGPFGGHATLASDLVAYWKLNETDGVREDSIGALDLTDNNTVTSTGKGVGAPTNMPDTVAQFTAANDESLSRASVAAFSAGDATISVWFNPDTFPEDFASIVDHDGAARAFLVALRSAAQNVDFYVLAGGAASKNSGVALSAGTWYHHLAWLDTGANTVNISVNGGVAASGSAGGFNINNTSTVRIGKNNGTANIDGKISSVGIWNRVLTAGERADLYNAGAGRFY